MENLSGAQAAMRLLQTRYSLVKEVLGEGENSISIDISMTLSHGFREARERLPG